MKIVHMGSDYSERNKVFCMQSSKIQTVCVGLRNKSGFTGTSFKGILESWIQGIMLKTSRHIVLPAK